MLNDSDLKKIGDLIDQRLNAGLIDSEERMGKKLEAMEKRIIQETGEFVSNNLVPQFDEKAEVKDVIMLEKRVGKLEKETLAPHLV